MKKISIHFNTYQNKIKGLPALLIFFIILLVILLIPLLICLAIAVGICWSIVMFVLNIFIPARKNKITTPIVTIPVEEVKTKND